MIKKGQVQESTFMRLAALIVVSGILIFGYTAIRDNNEKQCEINSLRFMKSIENEVSRLDSSTGSMKREVYHLGCGIDQLYFIDLDEDVSSYFDENAIINSSIDSGTQKNVFMLSDGIIKKDFYVENLEIEFPYYLCIKPDEGEFSLMFEGTGLKTKINNPDSLLDCSFMEVMEEIVQKTFPDEDPEEKARDFIEEVKESLDSIKESRTFDYDEAEGKTKVTVNIKVKEDSKKLRYIEIIAKCFANDVDEIDFDIPPTKVINEDPLLMWEFDNVKEGDEITISYSVQKMIDELCKQFVESLSGSFNQNQQSMSDLFKNQRKNRAQDVRKSMEKRMTRINKDLDKIDDDILDNSNSEKGKNFHKMVDKAKKDINKLKDEFSKIRNKVPLKEETINEVEEETNEIEKRFNDLIDKSSQNDDDNDDD